MGFLDSIQSAVGVTINARANLGIDVPNGIVNNILGFVEEETDIDIVGAINDLSLYAKLLYCFGTVMTSPQSMFNILSGMAVNLAGTLAQAMGEVMEALMMQIDMAITTTLGTVSNAINAVLSLIDSIVSIVKVLANLPKLFVLGGLDIKAFLLSREACEEVLASILACLLNKFFGDPIETFKNKLIGKINEYGYTANQALVDEFADINVISAYVQQESFLLTKASYQMEGLYADFGVTMDVAPVAQANATAQAGNVKVDDKGNVTAKGTKVPKKSSNSTSSSSGTDSSNNTGGTVASQLVAEKLIGSDLFNAANYMFEKGNEELANPLSPNDPVAPLLNQPIKITPNDGTISL